VICVILSAPRKAIYGGAVAAPTFAAIGEFCMEHLKISPSPQPRKQAKKTIAKKPATNYPAKKASATPGSHPRGDVNTGGNSAATEAVEPAGSH
jgi:hypothetical protein